MAMLQARDPAPCSNLRALAGTWKLEARRAITLEPREAGILRVAQGQIWATYDGPHEGPLNDLGDRFVGAGEQLRIRPGQRVVVEAWKAGAPAFFTWDPAPGRRAGSLNLSGVVQPLADLRHALVLVAQAVGRLTVGLARLGWQVASGRAARCAEEGACGRHGAMG